MQTKTHSEECKVLNLFEGLIFLLACSVYFCPFPTVCATSLGFFRNRPESSADKMYRACEKKDRILKTIRTSHSPDTYLKSLLPLRSLAKCMQRELDLVSSKVGVSECRKRGFEFKGGSRHDRNRRNRHNHHGRLFVLYFAGQARGGQGAFQNRQTVKTAKPIMKTTPLNSTPLFRHPEGRSDTVSELQTHPNLHSPV